MGSVLAGAALGPLGYFGAKAIENNGGISNALGVQNNYQSRNPYDQSILQGEVNNQAQIYAQQQALAQALQQQMAGNGPNPAQTQFLGNTQHNIANTQGLIASNRGLNPALAARMGANAAAQANQEAALGSALVQQQQQLGATSNLGNLYNQMQQGNLGYQGLYNQANLGSQRINADIATGNTNRNAQLVGGVINAVGGVAGAAAGASRGGVIGGKANVAGDSSQNDTVPTMLSPGEIIIPRSQAHDPEKAKEFIDHLLKEKKSNGRKEATFGDVIAVRRAARRYGKAV